jgi:two-component system sensor histidine kinase UhpB
MKTVLKILILEDSISDVGLIQRLLKKEEMQCEFSVAMTKKDFTKNLSVFSPDIILSDNSLPQFNSSDALKTARRQLPHIPFILVSGTIPEEYAASIIKQGADDFILKDRMARLPAAIEAALKHRLTEKEKRDTIEQLKENEKKYRILVERVFDGFYALDLNWNFEYVNKKTEELMNRPYGSLLGKNIWATFPWSANNTFYKACHEAIETQVNIHLKEYSTEIDKWLEINVYPSATGISVYFRDITEQRKAEENLKLLEAEMLAQKIQEQRKTARAIIKAQEKERNHIGQELHDNINQILAGSKIYLSLAGKKNETIKDLIQYPMDLIDNSIDEIRLLCQKLVAPHKNIELQGLVRDILGRIDKTGIKTTFGYAVSNELLSDELKLNLFRVMQELTGNILKYAEAKNITVSIQTQNKAISIEVSDDGKGFDIEKKRDGIGISNITNRVESFNGKIEIESSPGNGCSVHINIPL